MKIYPAEVESMLDSGEIRFCYTIELDFDTPLYFSGAGFDITYNGNTYIVSGIFQGMEEFTRQAEMNVTEIQISFSLAQQTMIALVLGGDYYNKEVKINRVYLSENNQPIHVENVWKGKVTSYADDEDAGLVNLNITGVWAAFESANAWRTTINSQQKRYPDDTCFKYAAKAAETVYWGGRVASNLTGGGGSPSVGGGVVYRQH